MSTLLNATVKYPVKEIETRYGKRVNVLLITENGEEVRQWGNPGDPELTTLKRNQKIKLLKDNNDKYKIVQDTDKTSKVRNIETFWSENTKELLQKQSIQFIKFYQFCDKEVRQSLTEYQTEDSIRAITTTIFLQSMRKV